jgi:hypothetical protein
MCCAYGPILRPLCQCHHPKHEKPYPIKFSDVKTAAPLAKTDIQAISKCMQICFDGSVQSSIVDTSRETSEFVLSSSENIFWRMVCNAIFQIAGTIFQIVLHKPVKVCLSRH